MAEINTNTSSALRSEGTPPIVRKKIKIAQPKKSTSSPNIFKNTETSFFDASQKATSQNASPKNNLLEHTETSFFDTSQKVTSQNASPKNNLLEHLQSLLEKRPTEFKRRDVKLKEAKLNAWLVDIKKILNEIKASQIGQPLIDLLQNDPDPQIKQLLTSLFKRLADVKQSSLALWSIQIENLAIFHFLMKENLLAAEKFKQEIIPYLANNIQDIEKGFLQKILKTQSNIILELIAEKNLNIIKILKSTPPLFFLKKSQQKLMMALQNFSDKEQASIQNAQRKPIFDQIRDQIAQLAQKNSLSESDWALAQDNYVALYFLSSGQIPDDIIAKLRPEDHPAIAQAFLEKLTDAAAQAQLPLVDWALSQKSPAILDFLLHQGKISADHIRLLPQH